MLDAKLVVVGGDAKAKQVSLNLPTVIGRGKDVSLTLPHALVSRKHTEIFEKDGWLFVKDLGSLNGTYVNNRRIKDAQKLLPNHLLTLGNVTFRAVYEAPVVAVPTEAEQSTEERDEDETINFEELPAEHPTDERDTPSDSKDESAEKAATSEKAATASADDSIAPPEFPVLRKDAASESAALSGICPGDEEFMAPSKSISISSLEGLPSQAVPSSMSFLGDQLKDIGGSDKQAIDSIDLDFPQAGASAESDVDLGSFLRKIPR